MAEPLPMVAHDDVDEAGDGESWPPLHQLTNVWEEDASIRRALRRDGRMLVWPEGKELIGVATLQALTLNRPAVADALVIWGAHSEEAKSPPIEWLKVEASGVFKRFCYLVQLNMVEMLMKLTNINSLCC